MPIGNHRWPIADSDRPSPDSITRFPLIPIADHRIAHHPISTTMLK
jgi:hypothetical protein